MVLPVSGLLSVCLPACRDLLTDPDSLVKGSKLCLWSSALRKGSQTCICSMLPPFLSHGGWPRAGLCPESRSECAGVTEALFPALSFCCSRQHHTDSHQAPKMVLAPGTRAAPRQALLLGTCSLTLFFAFRASFWLFISMQNHLIQMTLIMKS